MSDYIPNPCTEMHINQMPEECLRALFTQMPFKDQFEAGNVCRHWRTIRNALFRIQKSLVVVVDHSSTDASSGLIITGLNKERTAFLVAMFPSLTELAIFTPNRALFGESPSVAHLLVQYRNRLITLKLNSRGGSFIPPKKANAGDVLLNVINSMSQLKQLTLGFQFWGSDSLAVPFDLPILRQLDKLDFHSITAMPTSLITLWTPHLEARLTPMEINFSTTLHAVRPVALSAFYESITPKVASMFTHLPTFYCTLQQFLPLSTRFTNLIELSLFDGLEGNAPYSVDTLMMALANLKQLSKLFIFARYFPQGDGHQSGDHLPPQLPTVKQWHLSLIAERTYSHAHLFPWTANLGWLFPHLENFSIRLYDYQRCTDCGFNFLTKKQLQQVKMAQAKDCLRQQLRLIVQQQFPKLTVAFIFYNQHFGVQEDDDVNVTCTLADITD